MKVPEYQVGDLIVAKPECWKGLEEYENAIGIIMQLMFHSPTVKEHRSFLVRFENVFPLIKDRIIWHSDVLKHYPVVK